VLSLHKLEIFEAVVQEGSFSGAAERLLMTQSAVSQHIQSLESGVGAQLFQRGRRGVRLTDAGEMLHQYTQRILALVAEAEARITQVENLPSGQVRIGATPGVSVYLLPRWIQIFQATYPNLSVSLSTGTTTHVVRNVLNHDIDVGFIEGEIRADEYPRLGVSDLETITHVLVVGRDHPWWDQSAITFDALTNQPFLVREADSQTGMWIQDVLAANGVKPKVVARFDNPESIKQAVISGLGVSFLPTYTIQSELDAGTLRCVEVQGVALERSLKIVWDAQQFCTPVTRAFLTLLSGIYANIARIAARKAAALHG
jgi:LysR family transcriptional regulator, low CO2-responsive transcriptional regulator